MSSETRTKVVQIIEDVCRPERPDLSDHGQPLLAGALDSLDFATVLMALEDEFSVSIGEEEMETLSSIDDIVGFLQTRAAA